jgi:hypothetical protein
MLVAAARRVLGALVALPRQLVSLARPRAAWPSGPPDPVPGIETEPEPVRRIGGWVIGLICAAVANAAALILVFAAARAIYYPFWAAGASMDELDTSTAIATALAGRLDPRFLSRSELADGHPRRGRPA